MFFNERTVARMQRSRWPATLLILGVYFGLGVPLYAEKPPTAGMRLPLRTLGFPGHPLALMHAGHSMATLHVLDASHLLFTYSMRSLVPRIPGEEENDGGRLVAAEIVEVPSGKILARTEWHLRDYGRYLWSVGNGLFVVRIGEGLSTFAPMRGLASGSSFQRVTLPHRPGLPEVVESSPDGAIVTVEIAQPVPESEREEDADGRPKKRHFSIEFYRVTPSTEPGTPVQFRHAGLVGAPKLLALALDGDGYLWADDKERGRWALSFNEYDGKPQDLAALNSSCRPRLQLLSRSQFAAVSCRGTDDAHLLSSFGFDGHETWEEPFGESLQPPIFIPAPGAGRFAMSRLVANAESSGAGGAGAETTRQEIRVYQTESGQLLMNLHPIPAMRSGQNFDLSADGRTLAVLGSEAIELYSLPELSSRDRKDLAEVANMAPPEAHGPVTLRRITRQVVPEPVPEDGANDPSAVAGRGTGPETAQPPAGTQVPAEMQNPTRTSADPAPANSAGDGTGKPGTPGAAPGTGYEPAKGRGGAATGTTTAPAGESGGTEAVRKAPTLLKPGETPDFKPAGSSPQ